MTDKELDQLKAEIDFHKHCRPCRACGECERILDIAIKERQELQGGKATEKPCESCRT
jgi:hypothetical protein